MSRIYNCHTHIFNIENSPKNFLAGFVGKMASAIASPVLNTGIGSYLVVAVIKRFFRNNVMLQRYASFIKVGTMKSQLHVFRDLMSNYDPEDRFVILSLNMDHMGAGAVPHDYSQQIYEIKRIKSQYPDSCLPFYSIDPRAGSPEQLVEECKLHIGKRKQFVGIKIYPALGFYPFHPHLEAVYKWASEHEVPVMTHCTRVGSFYMGEINSQMIHPDSFVGEVENWPELYGKPVFPLNVPKKNKNKEFSQNFSHLHNYAGVLERYPDLKICFAHAGDETEIKKARNQDTEQESWFTHIKFLMKTYPNVYTDISYTLSDNSIHKDLMDLLSDDEIGHKVLFGTDYFMTLREKKESKLLAEFRQYLYKNDTTQILWEKVSNRNPKPYLTSAFYRAT